MFGVGPEMTPIGKFALEVERPNQLGNDAAVLESDDPSTDLAKGRARHHNQLWLYGIPLAETSVPHTYQPSRSILSRTSTTSVTRRRGGPRTGR